ncbi:hypothetical protein GGI03_004211 [Coemansia sp. RSA 2337]|nr:hypothetical protein LPJ71_003728 [Coemansia sp. S17]KAJ2052166.1 hypothetical protein H4S04_001526 [Coemansia sp. S16]KAJ2350997.1 hypothetical protein GGH92_002071 [Coemansia sp. RSA 2673]KAJ2462863.1 hypothetical protein GGI03_004211 [Coemansia sp. RSA 2337]
MANDSTSDYFALVNSHGEEQIDSQAIEAGLLAAIADTGAQASRRQEYISTILSRFVYSAQDRHTARATNLALTLLKTLGRQIDDTNELGTERAISGLLSLALDLKSQAEIDSKQADYAVDACNEALTCVANTMLLLPKCRPLFADIHGADTINKILQSGVTQTTAFLCGRCLFLSIESPKSAEYCVDSLYLPKTLAQTIRGFLDRESDKSDRFSPQQVMNELFKAAMSLCVYYPRDTPQGSSDDALSPEHAVKLLDILQVSLDTLFALPLANGHLADPARQAIGIALNFPTLSPDPILHCWLPPKSSGAESERYRYVDRIYHLFATLAATSDESYKAEITPLALVLVRLVTEQPDVRQRLFYRVYPQNTEDYSALPEDRPGLSGTLVRLMRIPEGGMVSGAIGDFLLALLGQDVSKFILAVGYGNAAGYMLARGIAIPDSVIRQVRESVDSNLVDPVTGRYLNQDMDRELANMTDEEKEREAERLFVLFERLNKTGFIKVDNPVRTAMESGRFQEIDEESS